MEAMIKFCMPATMHEIRISYWIAVPLAVVLFLLVFCCIRLVIAVVAKYITGAGLWLGMLLVFIPFNSKEALYWEYQLAFTIAVAVSLAYISATVECYRDRDLF